MPYDPNYAELVWASREIFQPRVVDQFFKSNPIARMLRKRVKMHSGGRKIVFGSLYGAEEAQFLGSKWDPITAAYKEEYGAAEVDPKVLVRPVIMNLVDVIVNGPGREQTMDMLKLRSIAASRAMSNTFGNSLFALDYTISGSGLAVGAFDSLDRSVNDATGSGDETGYSAKTYGGITRAASGDGATWNAVVDDSTPNITPDTVNRNFLKASEGDEQPTMYASNNKAYSILWNQLTSIQREAAENLTGMAGFQALLLNGKPWVVDSHVPSADRSVPVSPWGTAPATEYVYGFNMNHIEMHGYEGAFFSFQEIAAPHDKLLVLGRYLTVGNVVNTSPRLHFKMTGAAG